MNKTLFWIACLLPVLLPAQPVRTIDRFRAEQVFRQGEQAYLNRDYWNAVQAFNEVEKLNPAQPRLYEFRAESYFNLNKFEEALADYSRALASDPVNAELFNSKGVAAARLARYDEAMDNFYQALRIDANHTGAKTNLDIAQKRRQEMGGTSYAVNPVPVTTWAQPGSTTWSPGSGQPSGTTGTQPGQGSTWNQYTSTNPAERGQDLTARPPVKPADRTYGPDKFIIGGQTDPMIVIKQVRVNPSGTQVTFEVSNASGQPFPVSLDRIGGVTALFITDKSFTRQYRLRSIRGLRDWPNTPLTMQPGDKPIVFVAEFDKIDDDITVFHVLEGTENRTHAWDFYEVRLID